MDPERGKEEEDGFGINPESRSKETRRCQRRSAGREGREPTCWQHEFLLEGESINLKQVSDVLIDNQLVKQRYQNLAQFVLDHFGRNH